jgi:hypothetical protein
MVVQRIVVRHDMSFDIADLLLHNIKEHLTYLRSLTKPTPSAINALKLDSDKTKTHTNRFHH